MNLQELNLDQRIDRDHAALERAEQDALAIEQRMRAIGGAAASFAGRRRSYGNPPNPWAANNLSAQIAIQQADPALATFLAKAAGKALPAPDYDRLEREAERAASATRLAEATELMRARREARAAAQQATVDPVCGKWSPFLGKWI